MMPPEKRAPMRTVLHIGTHKTGTSSLQNFLATNRRRLQAAGIYYPSDPRSVRNFNAVAADVALERTDRARSLIAGAGDSAQRHDCGTLLLSAESFYAMTTFFHLLLDRPVVDYWATERAALERLRALLPSGDVIVVAYFRRQDLYLESLYNQFVKQTRGYAEEIEQFLHDSGPAADYLGHMDLWAEVFGHPQIAVRSYSAAQGNVVHDFCETVLGIAPSSGFAPATTPVNPPLGPELIAFKRATNRVPMPLADSYMQAKAVGRVARDMPRPEATPALLSDDGRRALLTRHGAANAKLVSRYAPASTADGFLPAGTRRPTEAGSTADTAGHHLEALLRYRREAARPAFKAELYARRAIRFTLRQLPWFETLLRGPRQLMNRARLRREREGRL